MSIVATAPVLVPLHRFPTYIVAVSTIYTLGGFIYGLTAGREVLMAREEEDDAPTDEAHAAR